MRILIDTLSSQVQVQLLGIPKPLVTRLGTIPALPPRLRLNTLLGAMHSAGASLLFQPNGLRTHEPAHTDPMWEVGFSCGPIDEKQLAGFDVLCIFTHHPAFETTDPAWVWSAGELDAIEAFVEKGGGLLLMSNHQNFPQYDIPLAARFGVVIQNVFVSNAEGYMVMSGDRLNTKAFGRNYLFGVDSLVAHDGCAFSPALALPDPGFTWMAKFPAGATQQPSGEPVPEDWFYAAHVKRGNGQAVFVANSGTVCDFGGAPFPACGQVTSGSNLMFAINCIRMLLRQPQSPAPGVCPGGMG